MAHELKYAELSAFTTGKSFLGTNLLEFSTGRNYGALKGLLGFTRIFTRTRKGKIICLGYITTWLWS